jgi:hypothetical protein
MAGTYLAKAITVAATGYPAAWNVHWVFPGVFPPGYVPALLMTIDAPTQIVPGEAAEDITFTLLDGQVDDNFKTDAPSEKIFVTATLLSTGEECMTPTELSYSDIGGGFYGATTDITFDIDSSDVGDYVVLRATTSPLGQTQITAEANIEIITTNVWSAKLTFSMSDVTIGVPSGSYGGAVQFQKKGAGWGGTVWPYCWVWNYKEDLGTVKWGNDSSIINAAGDYEPSEGPYNFGVRMQDLTIPPDSGHDDDPWILATDQNDGVMVIEVANLLDHAWYIGYSHPAIDTEGPSVTFSYVLRIYKNDRLRTTNTFQLTKYDNDPASTGYPTPVLKWEISAVTKTVTTH